MPNWPSRTWPRTRSPSDYRAGAGRSTGLRACPGILLPGSIDWQVVRSPYKRLRGIFSQNAVQTLNKAGDVGVGEHERWLDLQHIAPRAIHADQNAQFPQPIAHIRRCIGCGSQRRPIADKLDADEEAEAANIADDRVVRREVP